MRILEQILSVLFPDSCVGCRRSGALVCDACSALLSPAGDSEDEDVLAVFSYRDVRVKTLVRTLKYFGARRAADILGKRMAEILAEHVGSEQVFWGGGRIVLVPVPLSARRRRMRGFNQSELLARSIVAQGISPRVVIDTALVCKVRDTKPQARMRSRAQRMQNLHDCFSARSGNPYDIIVLIDDVSTTGATIAALRQAVIQAGYRKIFALVAAH